MSMNASEMEFYETYADRCMNGSGASCVCACPFNLDIPLFIDKLKIHSYTGAYNIYQESVVFPEIVSQICPAPCKAHCVFGDAPIQLPILERTCVANIKDKGPSFYNMPARTTHIAIVGAGLSGLTCALKLRMKNYKVTVFEKSDRIGGNLWNLLDSAIFMEDIETQFEYFPYDLRLNTEITDLDSLAEFDAVYIATGSDGLGFGLVEDMNRKSYGSTRPGFFLGGRLIGGGDMDAIEHGKIASFSIELYLQIKKMDGVDTTYHVDHCQFPPPKAAAKGSEAAVEPADGELYDRDEVEAEAGRCLKCDCSACYDRCELMQSIRQYPTKMVKDAVVSMFPVPELEGKRISTRIIGTCLQCGACKDFCPTDIDLEKFFSDFRHMMAEEGSFPPPFHNFFVQDYLFTETDDVRVVRPAPNGEKGKYAFFPGCQLGGVVPEAVLKTYGLLLEKMPDTSYMAACCGVPAHWAGKGELFQEHLKRLREDWASLGEPTLILACVTCQKTFEAFLPEISTVSLYTLLADYSFPDALAGAGERVAVFDPCASRRWEESQKSVRDLAQMAGYELEELENSGPEAVCCGYGGHAHIAKNGYTDRITAKRVGESDLPYLAYCANCKESFVEQGKACKHILEVLFGLDTQQEAVKKSDRRQNRRQLKADMLETFWGEKDLAVFSPYDSLIIDEALSEKMNKSYIVADEIYKAIQSVEESGRVIYNPDTGVRIAHIRIGDMTYWSKYSKRDEGVYELHSAYSHRLNIEE